MIVRQRADRNGLVRGIIDGQGKGEIAARLGQLGRECTFVKVHDRCHTADRDARLGVCAGALTVIIADTIVAVMGIALGVQIQTGRVDVAPILPEDHAAVLAIRSNFRTIRTP